MKAGIIAAGHGWRLAQSHPDQVKPLVPVAGRPLCHWVAASLQQAGAKEISLLHNSQGRAIRESLKMAFPAVRWTFLQADTASSWESFRLVSRMLASTDPYFLVSTADTIAAPDDVAEFVRSCRTQPGLALTSFVDDEKPLWADLVENGMITAIGDGSTQRKFVTAGLYHMTAAVAEAMPPAAAHDSLRKYWGGLLAGGTSIAGFALSKTIDVDRPEDIAQAEAFLKEAIEAW